MALCTCGRRVSDHLSNDHEIVLQTAYRPQAARSPAPPAREEPVPEEVVP